MNIQTTPGNWPGPGAPASRRHWWSIQPAPAAKPISARRAYAEVLGVFGAFFAASIIVGAETLTRSYPTPSGSWAVFAPLAVNQLALAALALLVAVLLSRSRGITPRSLGLGLPRRATGKLAGGPIFRAGVWAVTALVVGGVITAQLTANRLAHPARPDASFYLLFGTAASIAAGVIEEVVVLAFVVSTLRQARRPLPEIVVVAVLLRCSYHDYYGPGVVGIAVWAIVFIWLYLRLGSVMPLIVVHILWDILGFYAMNKHWLPAIAALQIAAVLLLPPFALITLLADASHRSGPDRTPAMPGGLYGQREGGNDEGRDRGDHAQPA
jgi:membrane protease YdiL (CAAX protease family)